MDVKASLNNVRVAPRKARLVTSLIRGLDVSKAKVQLHFLVKKTSMPMEKLLDSALANAKHNFKLNAADLYISEIYVNEGKVLKRGRSRARGRVFPIKKKTSHIHLTLSEKKDKQQKAFAAQGKLKITEKPVKTKETKADAAVKAKPAAKKASSAKNPAAQSTKRLTGLARRAFNVNEKK